MDGPWYQVVAFVGPEPTTGQAVYAGHLGWLPQVAIRRRFRAGDEDAMFEAVSQVAANTAPFDLKFADPTKPEHMPVEVIEVEATPALRQFHVELFRRLGNAKYSDREGVHYYPHMTISWQGEGVVEAKKYARTQHKVEAVWIIKDDGADSIAIRRFRLAAPMV